MLGIFMQSVGHRDTSCTFCSLVSCNGCWQKKWISYQEMEHAVTKGIYDGMSAILILLAVGALVGTWISGGIVPSLIYYGLKVIHPSIFLLATLILCSITSIATGTSWGTVGTSGIA